MGLSNPERKKTKFVNLKAKVDGTNDPHFALSEKVDGKWTNTDKFTQVTGTLIDAEIREKEYDGSKQNIFVLTIKDGEENILVSMTHNQVTYSIISSLASVKIGNPMLLIRLYKKESSKDGNTYWNGHAYIEADGEKLNWSVMPKDAPAPVQVMVDGKPFLNQGKPVFDSSARRSFYENIFTESIIKKLVHSTEPTAENSGNEGVTQDAATEEQAEGDDLPF